MNLRQVIEEQWDKIHTMEASVKAGEKRKRDTELEAVSAWPLLHKILRLWHRQGRVPSTRGERRDPTREGQGQRSSSTGSNIANRRGCYLSGQRSMSTGRNIVKRCLLWSRVSLRGTRLFGSRSWMSLFRSVYNPDRRWSQEPSHKSPTPSCRSSCLLFQNSPSVSTRRPWRHWSSSVVVLT